MFVMGGQRLQTKQSVGVVFVGGWLHYQVSVSDVFLALRLCIHDAAFPFSPVLLLLTGPLLLLSCCPLLLYLSFPLSRSP
jgi:hypothetical protein